MNQPCKAIYFTFDYNYLQTTLTR